MSKAENIKLLEDEKKYPYNLKMRLKVGDKIFIHHHMIMKRLQDKVWEIKTVHDQDNNHLYEIMYRTKTTKKITFATLSVADTGEFNLIFTKSSGGVVHHRGPAKDNLFYIPRPSPIKRRRRRAYKP